MHAHHSLLTPNIYTQAHADAKAQEEAQRLKEERQQEVALKKKARDDRKAAEKAEREAARTTRKAEQEAARRKKEAEKDAARKLKEAKLKEAKSKATGKRSAPALTDGRAAPLTKKAKARGRERTRATKSKENPSGHGAATQVKRARTHSQGTCRQPLGVLQSTTTSGRKVSVPKKFFE